MPKKKAPLKNKKKTKSSKKRFVFPKLKITKKLIKNTFAVFFMCLGVFFFVLYKTPPPTKQQIVIDEKILSAQKKPQQALRIVSPNLNIDLPIVEAPVVKGVWEVSETTASHGMGSANPEEKGNIVIFAHAREGLFYNLKNAKVGDTMYLLSKTKWRKYKVFEITTVRPTDVQVIRPTERETLTLFTCSGFYDEKRLIVKAYPQK